MKDCGAPQVSYPERDGEKVLDFPKRLKNNKEYEKIKGEKASGPQGKTGGRNNNTPLGSWSKPLSEGVLETCSFVGWFNGRKGRKNVMGGG